MSTLITPTLRHLHKTSNGAPLLMINGYKLEIPTGEVKTEIIPDYIETTTDANETYRARIGDRKTRVKISATVRNCDSVIGKILHESRNACEEVEVFAASLNRYFNAHLTISDIKSKATDCECCPIDIELKETTGTLSILEANYDLFVDNESQLSTLNDIPLDFLASDIVATPLALTTDPVGDLVITDCGINSNNITFTWLPSSNADYYDISISEAGGSATVIATEINPNTISYSVPVESPFVNSRSPISVTILIQAYREIGGQLIASEVVSATCDNIIKNPNPPRNLAVEIIPFPSNVYRYTVSWDEALPNGQLGQAYLYDFGFTSEPRGTYSSNLVDDFPDSNVTQVIAGTQNSFNLDLICTSPSWFRFRARTISNLNRISSWVAIQVTDGTCS